jgi:hypothetical protein
LQSQREIKINIEEFDIELTEGVYTISKNGIVLKGDLDELPTPQKTWLINAHSCSQSLVRSLNFDNSLGI